MFNFRNYKRKEKQREIKNEKKIIESFQKCHKYTKNIQKLNADYHNVQIKLKED